MSDPAFSRPEAARDRATALLARVVRSAHAPHGRADTVLRELMRPESYRPSELQRHLVERILDSLFAGVERALCEGLMARDDQLLPPAMRLALSDRRTSLARPVLARERLPDDGGLAAALLRRADEYRVGRHLRKSGPAAKSEMLDGLVEHDDAALAAAARRLLAVESRLNDRFDDPRLGLGDLPEAVARRFAWAVAAAYRHVAVDTHGLDGFVMDEALQAVTGDLLARAAGDQSLGEAAMGLVRSMAVHDLLDDRALADALADARPGLYVAMVATRAALPYETVWDMAIALDSASHMAVLRAIGVNRAAASQLLVAMARASAGDDQSGEHLAAQWIPQFDAVDRSEAAAALASWRQASEYREAVARLTALDSEQSQ